MRVTRFGDSKGEQSIISVFSVSFSKGQERAKRDRFTSHYNIQHYRDDIARIPGAYHNLTGSISELYRNPIGSIPEALIERSKRRQREQKRAKRTGILLFGGGVEEYKKCHFGRAGTLRHSSSMLEAYSKHTQSMVKA